MIEQYTDRLKHNILSRHPKDLTIDWAQRVVNLNYPDTSVLNISIVSVDIGTTTRVRVIVELDNPDILPQRWFIKLPSLAWKARLITALPRLLHTEVRFYNELASTIPINVPDFIAAQSRFGLGATLVLFDIAESEALGMPSDALTVIEAMIVTLAIGGMMSLEHNRELLSRTIAAIEDHDVFSAIPM